MLYILASFLLLVLLCMRFVTGKTSLHIDFFLFGVLYYFFVPGVVYNSALFMGAPGIMEWTSFSRTFFVEYQLDFIFLVFLWVASFMFGCLIVSLARNLYPARRAAMSSGQSDKLFSCALIIILYLIFIYYFYIGREVLLSGYSNYDKKILGGLAALSLVTYSVFLNLRGRAFGFLKSSVLSLLLVLFLVLLFSGSRMYVLVPVTGFIALGLLRFRQIKVRVSILIFVVLIGMVFSLFGILRSATLTLGDALYIFVAEPIFSSYSFISFWLYNDFLLFEFPWSFLSSFLNLVPSLVWPGKEAYIYDLSVQGYYVYAPLGAESIFASLVANFGVIGSALVLSVIGGFLQFLYFYRGNGFFLASYTGFLSLIPFMFFRDPFSIFLKSLVLVSFLVPFLFLCFEFFSRSLKKGLG